jgi:hypothetical protein
MHFVSTRLYLHGWTAPYWVDMQIPSTLDEILKQLRVMMTNDGLKAFACRGRSRCISSGFACVHSLGNDNTQTQRERRRGHLKFYCALSLQILITFFFPSRPQRNKIMAPPHPRSLSLPSKHTQSCYNNNNNYLLWQRAAFIQIWLRQEGERKIARASIIYCRVHI